MALLGSKGSYQDQRRSRNNCWDPWQKNLQRPCETELTRDACTSPAIHSVWAQRGKCTIWKPAVCTEGFWYPIAGPENTASGTAGHETALGLTISLEYPATPRNEQKAHGGPGNMQLHGATKHVMAYTSFSPRRLVFVQRTLDTVQTIALQI